MNYEKLCQSKEVRKREEIRSQENGLANRKKK